MGSTDAGRVPARALPLLFVVSTFGLAVGLAASLTLAIAPPSQATIAGVAVLLAAAALSEAFPVPLDNVPAGQLSLAAVFVIGAAALYGWAEATLIAVGGRAIVELMHGRRWDQLVYNSSVYTLAAAAAGGAAALLSVGGDTGSLALDVVVASAAFFVVNVALITAMIARVGEESLVRLVAHATTRTSLPFAIMASGALMLAVLWDRSPLLSLALVGPLLAIALYQRSMHRALVATRLALTDPLTGLGNHRHFHERLQQELDSAAGSGRPLALSLLDVDDLKRVNDAHGHPVGDRLLREAAACLRRGGEAFRVGGDEFALLLPARSTGVAVFPSHCSERAELYRCADDALYASKREGKNRVHVYRPTAPQPERKAS